MSDNEKIIKESFREFLGSEVKHPSVKLAKDKLLKEFTPPTPFLLRPGVYLPLAAFLLLGALAFWMFVVTPRPAKEPLLIPGKTAAEAEVKESVQVKRVASRVGPTLVYQKVAEGVPVTVIWVFNGRGIH